MLGLVAIVLFVPALSQGKAWHGIVPLHSARADVERLLGRPSIDRLEAIYYDLADEKVSIHLSMGRCSDRSGSWNIPRNTVISIWVTPKQLHLSDLKVDFTKFDKKQDDELAYIFHYVDSNEGLTYQVDERMSNFVTLIQYFGTRADEKLRCPSKADAPARRRNRRIPHNRRHPAKESSPASSEDRERSCVQDTTPTESIVAKILWLRSAL